MENSGLGGAFLSGATSGGFLDLESSIHRQFGNTSQNHHNLEMKSSLNMMANREDENSPTLGLIDGKCLNLKGFSMNFGRGTNNTTSEDDEPSFNGDENLNGSKGKKESSWQRMKWTDDIVRLLIQVVACVGDDDSMLENVESLKRRPGSLQKKGKWKTVSKIMIAKGCFVSPQQCEDKFNDLNKRYKRLNDILGRGTSCRVVENPSLMESMPQLSDKMKEDVKKILSSKHLFYKEICAYHNGQRIPNCGDLDVHVNNLPAEKEHDDDSEDEESDGEDQMKEGDGGNLWPKSNGQDCFRAELAEFFEDPTKGVWEQKEHIEKQMLQLQEQKVEIQAEAFEIEKRRFKWQRFSSKKTRELEISKLENERLILENERMVLMLKHKEFELDFKSLDPTSLSIEPPQARDHIDLSRH